MFEAGYGISTISYNLQRSEVAIYQQIEKQDLYCDKTRLNQVLLNFLSNAIKFTPAGGTVSVRLRQLPGTRKDREQYEIRVKDNGIGMSPEFAKKIFDPFERERSSTVSQIQGTGLGMAITKTCKNPAEAATLIQFLLNEEKGASIMGSECGIPASKAGLAAAQAAIKNPRK